MKFEFRRAGLLDSIEEALGSNPIVLLTGPRGAGKSHALARIFDQWEDGRGGRRKALMQLEPLACSPEVLDAELGRLGASIFEGKPGAPHSFDSLLRTLRHRRKDSLLFLDDVTEIRTLSYYPSVKNPLEGFLKALGSSGKAVATSRFSFWMEREFPSLTTIRLPPLSGATLAAAGVPDAELVALASGGLAGHAARLAESMSSGRVSLEDALYRELGPGGRIEAECRATLAELLHRARGYGACKSVLRVLAEEQDLKLTEVARRMDRTAGSTRDYLRWLEEVDLVSARDKRFCFVDPLLRLWMRIYTRGAPPDDAGLRLEVERYLEGLGRGAREAGDESLAISFTLPPPPSEDLVEID